MFQPLIFRGVNHALGPQNQIKYEGFKPPIYGPWVPMVVSKKKNLLPPFLPPTPFCRRQALIESKVGIRIHARLVRDWESFTSRETTCFFGDWFMMGSLEMAYEMIWKYI